MSNSNGSNGRKLAASWAALAITAIINISIAVGYVVSVRTEMHAMKEWMQRLEDRMIYLERHR